MAQALNDMSGPRLSLACQALDCQPMSGSRDFYPSSRPYKGPGIDAVRVNPLGVPFCEACRELFNPEKERDDLFWRCAGCGETLDGAYLMVPENLRHAHRGEMKKAVEKEMRESCEGCKHVLLVKWRNVHGRGSICQMCGAQLDEVLEGKFVKISEAKLEEATQRALTKARVEAEVSEGAKRAPAMRSPIIGPAGGDGSRRGAGEDDRDWHDVQLPEVENLMDDVAELEN